MAAGVRAGRAGARGIRQGLSGLRDDALGGRQITRDADQLKQRAFHVDIADDGSLRLPSQVGGDEARALVGRVRQILNSPGWRSMPFWLPPAARPGLDDEA